jgi:hypothetical protein
MAALCCLAIIDYPTILGKSTWRWLAEKCREQPCKSPLNIHQTIRANNSFWKNVQMLSGHSLALLQGAIYCDGFTMFQTHYSWSDGSEGFLIGDSPPAHCFCTAGVLVRPLSKTWSSCKMLCPQTCFILFNSGLWGFPASLISVYDLHHISWYNKNIQIHTNIYHILYMRDVSHQDAKHTTTVKLREWSTDMLLYKFRTPSIETGPWLWQWLPLEWRDLVLLLSSFIIFCLGIAETNSGKSWQSSSHDLFCFQSQSKQRTNMDQYSTFKIFQSGSRHHWARVFSAFSALSINRNASPWRWKAVVAVAPPSFVGQFDAETSICQHSRRARSTSCKYLIEHDW